MPKLELVASTSKQARASGLLGQRSFGPLLEHQTKADTFEAVRSNVRKRTPLVVVMIPGHFDGLFLDPRSLVSRRVVMCFSR